MDINFTLLETIMLAVFAIEKGIKLSPLDWNDLFIDGLRWLKAYFTKTPGT